MQPEAKKDVQLSGNILVYFEEQENVTQRNSTQT